MSMIMITLFFATVTFVMLNLSYRTQTVLRYVFFFQAEDGIRDLTVTGVQTCALPILASTPFDLKGKTVFVAGHRGMVGSALTRRLAQEDVELLTVGRGELDLRDQSAVFEWLKAKSPQVVFLAAAKVGGIVANNTLRAEFLYDNLAIAANG